MTPLITYFNTIFRQYKLGCFSTQWWVLCTVEFEVVDGKTEKGTKNRFQGAGFDSSRMKVTKTSSTEVAETTNDVATAATTTATIKTCFDIVPVSI